MPAKRDYVERFWEKVDKKGPDECWLWTAGKDGDGYGRMRIKGTHIRAHRVSWEIHHGPIPPGMHVLHQCDTPGCANPIHLYLGTNTDNVHDRDKKGRGVLPMLKGEQHGRAKLTETDILRIRDDVSSGRTQEVVAREFGITHQQVSVIVRRKQWGHIK